MPRRSSKWIIQKTKTGWNLSRGGRYMYEDLRSEQECLKRLKNHYKAGEPVVLEEIDGYRTNITDRLKKSRVL